MLSLTVSVKQPLPYTGCINAGIRHCDHSIQRIMNKNSVEPLI